MHGPPVARSSPTRSLERVADGLGQLDVAAGIHHHVGDPAHQVFAEADLRVHATGRREHLAVVEVAQMAGDGGRADVDGDADDPVDEIRARRR